MTDPVTIKPTAWGYSVYETALMNADNPHAGLIASTTYQTDAITYAESQGWTWSTYTP